MVIPQFCTPPYVLFCVGSARCSMYSKVIAVHSHRHSSIKSDVCIMHLGQVFCFYLFDLDGQFSPPSTVSFAI